MGLNFLRICISIFKLITCQEETPKNPGTISPLPLYLSELYQKLLSIGQVAQIPPKPL